MYELGQVVEFWPGVEHRVARRLKISRHATDLDTGEALDLSYEAIEWEWACVCCGTLTVGQPGYKPRLRCQACIDAGVPLPRGRVETEAEDVPKQPMRGPRQIKELKPRVSDGWVVGTVLPKGLAKVCPLTVTHMPTEEDGNFYFVRPDGRVYAYSPGGTVTRREDREPPKAPKVAKVHNFSGPRTFRKKSRAGARSRADIEWEERMEREAAARKSQGEGK